MSESGVIGEKIPCTGIMEAPKIEVIVDKGTVTSPPITLLPIKKKPVVRKKVKKVDGRERVNISFTKEGNEKINRILKQFSKELPNKSRITENLLLAFTKTYLESNRFRAVLRANTNKLGDMRIRFDY